MTPFFRAAPLLLLLLTATASSALVVKSDEGGGAQTVDSAPADGPNWDSIGSTSVGGFLNVYIGNGYVLAAGHTCCGNVVYNGVTSYAVPGGNVRMYEPGVGTPEPPTDLDDFRWYDLQIWRVSPWPQVPAIPLLNQQTTVGLDLMYFGASNHRGVPVNVGGFDGFALSGASGKQWGTNKAEWVQLVCNDPYAGDNCAELEFPDYRIYIWAEFNLSAGGPRPTTAHEAEPVSGDSGGPWFTKYNGVWHVNSVSLGGSANPVLDDGATSASGPEIGHLHQ